MTHARTVTNCLLFAAITLATGCRSKPPGKELPHYDNLTTPEVLTALAERAEAIQTYYGSGTLRLTDPERGEVSLDAVILARDDDRLRLRVWKLGRAVFDLTRDGDTLWLWTRDQDDTQANPTDALTAEFIGTGWSLVSGRLFADPPQRIVSERPLIVEYSLNIERTTTARLHIDRQTLTLTRCDIVSKGDAIEQRITPQAYRLINGVPTATRIESTGRSRFTLKLDDIEINGPLPETAFTPPRDARSRP